MDKGCREKWLKVDNVAILQLLSKKVTITVRKESVATELGHRAHVMLASASHILLFFHPL